VEVASEDHVVVCLGNVICETVVLTQEALELGRGAVVRKLPCLCVLASQHELEHAVAKPRALHACLDVDVQDTCRGGFDEAVLLGRHAQKQLLAADFEDADNAAPLVAAAHIQPLVCCQQRTLCCDRRPKALALRRPHPHCLHVQPRARSVLGAAAQQGMEETKQTNEHTHVDDGCKEFQLAAGQRPETCSVPDSNFIAEVSLQFARHFDRHISALTSRCCFGGGKKGGGGHTGTNRHTTKKGEACTSLSLS